MDVQRWDAWLERVIFGLVAGALSFAILAFGAVEVRAFLVVEALVALALGVWGLRIVLVRGHRLLWPPVCWGILLVAGWAAWRTGEADLAYVAHGEFFRILTYTALFFVVLNNLHRQDTAQGLAWVLVGLATLLCFYGAWQFASSSNSVWGVERAPDYLRRASGSYMCPNHFAGLLDLLTPVALSVLLAGRVGPLGRVFLGYAILVMLAGLALTFSRGGWIATGVGAVLVLLVLARHRDYRWPALACLGLLMLGAVVIAWRSPVMQKRLETSHDLNPQARNSRPNIWRAGLRMWEDHRWFGVGPAHFAERFKQYRTHWAHGEPERAHNDYLDALADWGVAGVAVFAVPWALLGYGILRTLRQVRRDPGDLEAKRSRRYAFVLGTTGGLAALLVHATVDFNFHIPANATVAVTWMALLAGYSRYATDNWWVSSRLPWRSVVIVLLLLPLLAALGWDLARRGRETSHLLRAAELGRGSETTVERIKEQLKEYQAAWAIEPRNAWTACRIGEIYLQLSFAGSADYEEHAHAAIVWFDRAIALNPYHPIYRIGMGKALDWLGEFDQADAAFRAAHELDPEGRITSFYQGWHALQRGNATVAQEWFNKSVAQGWPPYPPAVDYLRILHERAATQAVPVPPSPGPAEE